VFHGFFTSGLAAAMAAGLTETMWSMEQLLEAALSEAA